VPSYEWPQHVSAFLEGRSLKVAMYAYLDESGKFHDGSGYICLCGFLSWDSGWQEFADKWQLLLAKHHLPFIHMTTFYSDCRTKNLDEAEATGILGEFIDVVRHSSLIGFSVGVDGQHFRKRMYRDPALFAISRILRQMRDACTELARSKTLVPRIALTFDEDEAYSVKCYKLISRLRKIRPEVKEMIISVGFADDEWYSPLQAADVFANLTNRYWRDNMAEATPEPPELLKRLLTAPVSGNGMFMWQAGEFWNEKEIDKNLTDLKRASF
jgi:hypothetical protein